MNSHSNNQANSQKMPYHSLRKLFIGVALVTGLLLLVPLIAMQFTEQVSWTLADFIVAAVLLFGAGTAMVLGMRLTRDKIYRVAIVAAILSVLCLVWLQLAVGLLT